MTGITKWDRIYHKVWKVLQSVKFITTWGVTSWNFRSFLHDSFFVKHLWIATTNSLPFEFWLNFTYRSSIFIVAFEHFFWFYTAPKMKFFIKDFFSKCDQMRTFLQIWSHLPKKSLTENLIFSAVLDFTYLRRSCLRMPSMDYQLNCEVAVWVKSTFQSLSPSTLVQIQNQREVSKTDETLWERIETRIWT